MSNRSSVSGKYLNRVFTAKEAYAELTRIDKAKRYDEMILQKQRNELKRKRKLERQNKRKARKNK